MSSIDHILNLIIQNLQLILLTKLKINYLDEPTYFQGLLLIYVSMILALVVKQFGNLSSIEDDHKRLLVVDSGGTTQVESLRTVKETSSSLV